MPTPMESHTFTTRTLSWMCFALVAILVAFWVVYFPIERSQLRPLAESINAAMPISGVFFLGRAWWCVPTIAAVIGAICLAAQLTLRNKLYSLATHVAASMTCLLGIAVYREALLGWFVELARNA